MVNILNPEVIEPIKFEELAVGSTFIVDKKLFIKIPEVTEDDSGYIYNTIMLEIGELHSMGNFVRVEPVDIDITIIR